MPIDFEKTCKFATKLSLNISPHLTNVATLPCEIVMVMSVFLLLLLLWKRQPKSCQVLHNCATKYLATVYLAAQFVLLSQTEQPALLRVLIDGGVVN